MRCLALAILATGCCPSVFHGADADPPPGIDLAVDFIGDRYMAAFHTPRRHVKIRWVESLEVNEADALGAIESCERIWLVAEGEKPSDTGLAHELAHCYAGHVPQTGCLTFGNNAHNEAWIWARDGLVATTQDALRERGL